MATTDKLALLKATKADMKAALTEQGQTPGDVLSEYPDMVRAIQTGVTLPTLTSPGAAADLRQGKQLIDQEGNVVDGTLVEVEQATPSISVSSAGLITATAGDKSATKQLETANGYSFTPSTSEQSLNVTGKYMLGPVIVAGDANLLPENIKSGVSIFGVAGSIPDYTTVGYVDFYDESDTDYVSVDLDNETITIKPMKAADNYGLAKITNVRGISIRIYENDDPYHELMFVKYATGATTAYNRWMYARWSGNASPSSGSAEMEHIAHGGFSYTYDETTGELVISGCDNLYKLTDGAFSFYAAITWRIS